MSSHISVPPSSGGGTLPHSQIPYVVVQPPSVTGLGGLPPQYGDISGGNVTLVLFGMFLVSHYRKRK